MCIKLLINYFLKIIKIIFCYANRIFYFFYSFLFSKRCFCLILAFFFSYYPFLVTQSADSSRQKRENSGITFELYLPPDTYLPSEQNNSISIEENSLQIITSNGTKETVIENYLNKSFPDIYLTVKYLSNTDKLYFYLHGKKLTEYLLKGKEFNVLELLDYLASKYEIGRDITYYKKYNLPLRIERIKHNYKKTYNTIKVKPEPKNSNPNPNLLQYTVSTTGLVGHWDASNLDNAGNTADSSDTATTWEDRSSSNNDGTLNTFTLPSNAASGWKGANTVSDPSVLHFDGSSDYVDAGSGASVASITSTVTIAAWIKLDSTGTDQKIVSNQNNINGGYKLSVYSNNKVEAEIRNATNTATLNRNVSGGTTLSAGTWYYVVSVYSDADNRLATYVDGRLDRELSTTTVLATGGTLHFGKELFENTYYFDGKIANIRIYNTALTAEQIRQNYLAEAYKFQTDAVAPGVYADEDLRTQTYKKADDTFDIYIEDANLNLSGDSDVANLNTISCVLGGSSLTTPAATESNYTGGLTFDGTNDNVTVASTVSGVKTVSLLVRPTSTTTNIIDLNGTASIMASAGTISATNFTSPTIYVNGAVSSTITANVWQLVTVTTNTAISASAIKIGRISSSYFTGQIANVQLYSDVLTATEIARLNRFRYEPVVPQSLVGWWKLDDDNVSTNTATTAAARKWNSTTNAIATDTNLNGTLNNFSFSTTDGWFNQYSYNVNKYTFTVPTLTGSNEIEKLTCTVTDDWGNTTATNEEVGGIFIARAPVTTTSVSNGNNLASGGSFTVTFTDSTPDTSILSNPTTPTITLNGSSYFSTCTITPSTLTKALTLDGTNDYVSIGSLYNGVKTVAFWVNPTTTSQNIIDLNGTAYISSAAGTLSATSFTSPTIYVDAAVSTT